MRSDCTASSSRAAACDQFGLQPPRVSLKIDAIHCRQNDFVVDGPSSMPACECQPAVWKSRHGYRLSNGEVELTTRLGAGHIVDFRLRGSPVNILWEAPWSTTDPHTFNPAEAGPLYGETPIGKFLSGYSGH